VERASALFGSIHSSRIADAMQRETLLLVLADVRTLVASRESAFSRVQLA
jgi:hypothetical protein